MGAVVGDDQTLWKTVPGFFTPDTPLYSENGGEPLKCKRDYELAKKLLAEAGYKNEPIVVLDATDQVIQHNATLVLVDGMHKAGINVDLQTVDWGTITARRTNKGSGPNGWHILLTTGGQVASENPAFSILLPARCEKSFPGWPCDEPYEKLRAATERIAFSA